MSMFNPFGLSSYTINSANISVAPGIETKVYLQKEVDKVFKRHCECGLFEVKHLDAANYCYKCGGKVG